jgi:hypothetical protein
MCANACIVRIVKTIFVVLAVVVSVGVARAQPGQTPPVAPPVAPPPAAPPYQCPPPGCVPMPYQYQPMAMTAEDQEILAQGEISDGAMVGGGLLAIFFGFGVGQAVQGRFGDTGWIFLLGEAGSYAVLLYGFADAIECNGTNCEDRGVSLMLTGLVAYGVFHVWGIVDAFAGPSKHNQRLRELRMRLGIPQPMPYYGRITPYVKHHEGETSFGVGFRF